MKKDNYRKILREKFRAANQLETGPLTEEDEEYLRILAEARANHAKIKAARQEARKRLAARAAAVFIVAALVSSSYLLGMKSDTKASADPDDEVKVVQQGDNIIIGPGVSEKDENVGVVKFTYKDTAALPERIRDDMHFINSNIIKLEKIVVTMINECICIDAYYNLEGKTIRVYEEIVPHNSKYITMLSESAIVWKDNGNTIYIDDSGNNDVYSFKLDERLISIYVEENCPEKEIEAIVHSLEKTKMD